MAKMLVEKFNNVVVSIKSSNTRVMVYTVRLLNFKMRLEEMAFPIHLGVTEAGDGEDGRIKSAVGIGTLLEDGIGVLIERFDREEYAAAIEKIKAFGDIRERCRASARNRFDLEKIGGERYRRLYQRLLS